jgi:large subunit ribosomal protein L21
MSYAIISLGGKQYRVSEGQRLLVDRLTTEDGKTFTPAVLLVGGDGAPALAPKDVTVTVKVLGQQRGPKIRIGKYKKRTGYKRHTGFRSALTQIEIESIGGTKKAAAKPKAEAAAKPKAEAEVVEMATVVETAAVEEAVEVEVVETAAVEAEAKPKPAAKPKAASKPRAAAKPKAEPAAEPDVAAETAKEDES